MTPLLYIFGYLAIGAVIVGILAGIDEGMFAGSDGEQMLFWFAIGWPILLVACAMFGVYTLAKHGVKQSKKFIKS